MKVCIRGAGVVGGFGCGLAGLEDAIRKRPGPDWNTAATGSHADAPVLMARTDVLRSVDSTQNSAPGGSLCPHGDSGQPSRP